MKNFKVRKRGSKKAGYEMVFWIRHQGFHLAGERTKEEFDWMEAQLRLALQTLIETNQQNTGKEKFTHRDMLQFAQSVRELSNDEFLNIAEHDVKIWQSKRRYK